MEKPPTSSSAGLSAEKFHKINQLETNMHMPIPEQGLLSSLEVEVARAAIYTPESPSVKLWGMR